MGKWESNEKKSIFFYKYFITLPLRRDFSVEAEIPTVSKVYSQEQE